MKVFSDNKLKPETENKYFVDGGYLDEKETRLAFSSGNMSHRAEVCLNLIEGHDVVDVGCYAGTFVKRAIEKYPDKKIIGVDYYEESLRIANMLYPDISENLKLMNTYKLDFENASFDCITFQEVIEHIEGAALAVKEMNRILRKEGKLIITTPNAYYWRHFFAFIKSEIINMYRRIFDKNTKLASIVFFENVEWNRHIFCWTPSTLLTLLNINGFEYEYHTYGVESNTLLERAILRILPFLGATIILKVRKVSEAPSELT